MSTLSNITNNAHAAFETIFFICPGYIGAGKTRFLFGINRLKLIQIRFVWVKQKPASRITLTSITLGTTRTPWSPASRRTTRVARIAIPRVSSSYRGCITRILPCQWISEKPLNLCAENCSAE